MVRTVAPRSRSAEGHVQLEVRAQSPALAEEWLLAREQGREGLRSAPAHRGLAGVPRAELEAEQHKSEAEQRKAGQ